jgi:hypothetical protein
MADDYKDDTAPPADRAPLHSSMHETPYEGDRASDATRAIRGIVENRVLAEYESAERFDTALGEDENRPGWLPSKFASPEAFGESYANLEREFHANRARIKELEAQLYRDDPVDLLQQMSEQAAGVYDQDADYNQDEDYVLDVNLAVDGAQLAGPQAAEAVWKQALQDEEVAAGAVRYVNETMAQIAPDWSEVGPLVAARITENNINIPADPQAAVAVLAGLYVQTKSDQAARTTALENDLAKRQAQTLSGSPGRPQEVSSDDAYWQSVVNAKSNRYGG